jgi:hypothetical protein
LVVLDPTMFRTREQKMSHPKENFLQEGASYFQRTQSS